MNIAQDSNTGEILTGDLLNVALISNFGISTDGHSVGSPKFTRHIYLIEDKALEIAVKLARAK